MTSTGTVARTRLAVVDRLRGAAVLLMVLDHVLVQVAPAHGLRYTVTRLSLPLFVGCAARVSRGTVSSRRAWQLSAVIVLELWANTVLHMGTPGPVALIVGCSLVMGTPWAARHVATIGALGLLQALYVPVGWTGYQPGLVLAWWCLGLLVVAELERLSLPEWLGTVGRRPLLWYVGHLLVLVVVEGWTA